MLVWGQDGCYIKKDWSPDRIGRAHLLAVHTVTKAEEFVQVLLMPRVRLVASAPRPVEVLPNVDRLVDFLNRP
jgi:hypothetical protein